MMDELRDEIIKRIEEHKAKLRKSVLLNSHDYDLDRAVEDALAPFDVCIAIVNQAINEHNNIDAI